MAIINNNNKDSNKPITNIYEDLEKDNESTLDDTVNDIASTDNSEDITNDTPTVDTTTNSESTDTTPSDTVIESKPENDKLDDSTDTDTNPTPSYDTDGSKDNKVVVHIKALRTVAGVLVPKDIDKELNSVSYSTITLDENHSLDVDLTEIVTLANYTMDWVEYYRQIASLGLEVTITDNRVR